MDHAFSSASLAAALTNVIAMAINQLGYKLSVHSGTMAGVTFALATLSLD